ncbi:hypothetical protein P3T42_001510 [Paraburkholderia sp. GAS38]|uniref:hypothetical protein n=1 Tax=Paraburkholderia sp. GAS38 TaxID=3035133 RepID=UPI003D1A5661
MRGEFFPHCGRGEITVVFHALENFSAARRTPSEVVKDTSSNLVLAVTVAVLTPSGSSVGPLKRMLTGFDFSAVVLTVGASGQSRYLEGRRDASFSHLLRSTSASYETKDFGVNSKGVSCNNRRILGGSVMCAWKRKRCILRAILALATLTFLQQGAWADVPVSFIRIQCLGAINRLEVSTFMTWNVCDASCPKTASLEKQGIYELSDFIRRYSKQPFECDLGLGQKAVLAVLEYWPGKALPGMEFEVTINGKPIVQPKRLDGDAELELQVQAFPSYADGSGRQVSPASVSTNLCFLTDRSPLSLPGSMSCERYLVDTDEGWKKEQADSAEYGKMPAPN